MLLLVLAVLPSVGILQNRLLTSATITTALVQLSMNIVLTLMTRVTIGIISPSLWEFFLLKGLITSVTISGTRATIGNVQAPL